MGKPVPVMAQAPRGLTLVAKAARRRFASRPSPPPPEGNARWWTAGRAVCACARALTMRHAVWLVGAIPRANSRSNPRRPAVPCAIAFGRARARCRYGCGQCASYLQGRFRKPGSIDLQCRRTVFVCASYRAARISARVQLFESLQEPGRFVRSQNALPRQHQRVRGMNFEQRLEEEALRVFEIDGQHRLGIDRRWEQFVFRAQA